MAQLDQDIRHNTVIRDMTEADCDRVAGIINQYATVEVLLWRTSADIRRNLSGFIVAVWRDKIIGCAALRDYGNGLYELRSLAVLPEFCGHGIGSLLVRGCIDLGKRRQGKRVFALTRRTEFFSYLGFTLAPKELFPQKVWSDCQACWKRQRCDEDAMLVDLVPPADAETATRVDVAVAEPGTGVDATPIPGAEPVVSPPPAHRHDV